ncbi:MAG: hypothetical protein ABI862_20375 [Ilumatobacteraceae bacterium]
MSALAHVFEAAGLSTVGISLVRGQAERSRPPRMLHCDFPLGRPLGRPGDAPFQHRVLAAAFGLLPRTDVPVLVDYDEAIVDDADQPLSCTLPPRHNSILPAAVDEAIGLRPAYERHRATSGVTNVVRLGGPERVAELIGVFVRIVDGEAWDTVGLEAAQLGQAGLDIRAYYEEAALALADHVPAARQAESWFYRTTETGALLCHARDIIRAAEAPRPAWFPLVPTGQPSQP